LRPESKGRGSLRPESKGRRRLAIVRSFALVLLLLATNAHAGSIDEPEATPTPVVDATPSPTPEAIPSPTPFPREEFLDEVPPRRPAVAGWLALAFPGAGHVYLKRPGRGAVFLGVEAVELGAIITTITTSGWDPEDPSDTRVNRALLPTAWLQNTHFLGVYDAWRIARTRAAPGRFRTPVPTPDTHELLLAPFAGRQLTRASVVVPLATVWAIGLGASRFGETSEANYWELTKIPVFSREVDRSVAFAVASGYYTTTFYSVGIGEEALFRGVIQTSLEEAWGPTWGWLAATAFFGSLHALNGSTPGESAIAVGATSIVGGYFGWMYQRDDHDLTSAIFMHTWYNVGIGLTTFLIDPEHQPFSAGVSIPF